MNIPPFLRPGRASRLFSLALGVALAGGVALAAWAASEDLPPPHPMGPPPMGVMVLPPGPMLDHLLDDVSASPTQRAQVHQIMDAAHADLRAGFEAGRADQARMGQLFAAPVVDPAAVETLRERIEQRHDTESRRMTQAMVDVSQVLTADQRQAIARRMAQGPRFGEHAAASSAQQ